MVGHSHTKQTAGWREEAGQPSFAPTIADERARALLLVKVVNFGDLRRVLGVGHADLLAAQVAERAVAALPEATVATVGRDLIELGLYVTDVAELNRAVACLRQCAARPLCIGEFMLPLRLSIGAALADRSDEDLVALVEAAEAALLKARTVEAPVIEVNATTVNGADGTDLGKELHIAVRQGELFLQYQPKLHLRRRAITSVEALIRWRHPQRGLVLPGDFIPAAEHSGAIKAMTLWTIRQAIADQRVMARDGYDLPVFINIAGVLLSDRGFVAAVCEMAKDCGPCLGFEITETSVIREPALAIEHLQQFAAIGVAITIDDYGAGLSSLAYLKELPARELKIDKLFVTQLSSSHRDPLIVRSTIDLAHALEMEVVAEGVETPAALALLSVMGCDMVQGFLISRPLSLEGLLDFLRQQSHEQLLDDSRSPLQRLTAVRKRA